MGTQNGRKSSNTGNRSGNGNRSRQAPKRKPATTASKSRSRKSKSQNSGFKFENLLLSVVVLAALGLGIMFYLQGEKPLESEINIAEANQAEQSQPSEIITDEQEDTKPPTETQNTNQPPEIKLDILETKQEETKEDIDTSETPFTIHTVSELPLPDNIISPYNLNYGSPFEADGRLSNNTLSWYFNRNSNHQPPTAQRTFDIRTLNGFYLGDISQKTVYLTFDEGYEYGFTSEILNILAEKNIQAAFFVTLPYVRSQPELIQRMINEGHLVCNHSVRHLSSPSLTDEEFEYEIMELERFYAQNFDAEMAKFFRPPMGEYSARTLALADNLGYRTVFWSFAYQDWIVDNQPGADVAYNTVMNNLHNGSVILLHAVSESNTQALPYIIDSVIEQGYRFGSLLEIQ
jgi:peptidoglycan-N-acetylmuramic acid deacetylase